MDAVFCIDIKQEVSAEDMNASSSHLVLQYKPHWKSEQHGSLWVQLFNVYSVNKLMAYQRSCYNGYQFDGLSNKWWCASAMHKSTQWMRMRQSGSANELKTVIDRYCVKTNRGSGADTDLRSLDHIWVQASTHTTNLLRTSM